MQRVAGNCPRGCGETLFLGAGGHVTCSLLECPEPDAASVLLHGVFTPNPTEAQTSAERRTEMERKITDEQALDQIAAILGVYSTDQANNPKDEVISDIIEYVQQTGRATDVPEGA